MGRKDLNVKTDNTQKRPADEVGGASIPRKEMGLMNDKSKEINALVKMVVEELITGKDITDGVWVNPQAEKVGKRKFREVREAVKPYGIRLEWIEYPIVDSHPWYFIREGEHDPTGWLKYAKKID